MAGKNRSAPPLWLAPLLSVVLAAAAFALAWLHGWPWGAFLLAEVLVLIALTAVLWRAGEGHPWWLYPALFVALVILVFSWLYLSGRLDLAGAVQAGSAVILAFFTITLWRSTQAQAEATQAMRELQQTLARSELVPCLAFSVRGGQFVQPRGPELHDQPLIEVCNLGRLGVLVEEVRAKEEAGSGGVLVERVERNWAVSRAPWRPVGGTPFPLAPGECAALWLGTPHEGHALDLELEFRSAAAPGERRRAVVSLRGTQKSHTQGGPFFTFELVRVEGACGSAGDFLQ